MMYCRNVSKFAVCDVAGFPDHGTSYILFVSECPRDVCNALTGCSGRMGEDPAKMWDV